MMGGRRGNLEQGGKGIGRRFRIPSLDEPLVVEISGEQFSPSEVRGLGNGNGLRFQGFRLRLIDQGLSSPEDFPGQPGGFRGGFISGPLPLTLTLTLIFSSTCLIGVFD